MEDTQRRHSSGNLSNHRPTAGEKEEGKKTESCDQVDKEKKKRLRHRRRYSSENRSVHRSTIGEREDSKNSEDCEKANAEDKRWHRHRSRHSSENRSNHRPTASEKEGSKNSEDCEQVNAEEKKSPRHRKHHLSQKRSDHKPTAVAKECSKESEQANVKEKKSHRHRRHHLAESRSNQKSTANGEGSQKSESCEQANNEERRRHNQRHQLPENRPNHGPTANENKDSKQSESSEQGHKETRRHDRRRHLSENSSNNTLAVNNNEDGNQSKNSDQANKGEKRRYQRRSRSRDSRTRTLKTRPSGTRTKSSDTRYNELAMVRFLGVQVSCVASSHDQIIKLMNDNDIKYTGFSILPSQYGNRLLDFNVQFNSNIEAETCKQFMNKHFDFRESSIISIHGNTDSDQATVGHNFQRCRQKQKKPSVEDEKSQVVTNPKKEKLQKVKVDSDGGPSQQKQKSFFEDEKLQKVKVVSDGGPSQQKQKSFFEDEKLQKVKVDSDGGPSQQKQKSSFEDEKSLVIFNLPQCIQQGDLAQLVTNPELCTERLRNIKMTSDGRALLVYSSRESAINAFRKLYGVRHSGRILDIRLRKHDPDLQNAIFNDLKHNIQQEVEESVTKIISQWDSEIQDLTQRVEGIKSGRKNKFIPLQEAERIDAERKDLTFKLNQLSHFKLELEQFIKQLELNIEQADEINILGKIRNEFWREIRKAEHPLPIYAFRSDIVNTVFDEKNNACVILGETGSGKSTQIGQYLADADILLQRDLRIRIACTQPRKVAAISLAKRVAEEYGCEVGEQVGYMVGSVRKMSSKTLITFMTDRVLLNSLLQDPSLEAFSCVVIDEAHERSIDTDILIALLKQVSAKRPELKIVITSATIDEQVFCSYFNDCPYMNVPGRKFPVQTNFSDTEFQVKTDYVKEAVEMAQIIHQTREPGDILVFMTSANEIERACGDLEKRLGIDGNAQILPLHGKLQPQDQMAIFNPPPNGKRKIVFATNIAETSVTIDGIRYVIDTGMVKERKYDPKRNMSLLEVTTISKASAEQRKGRAGRTTSGECFRLYSENDYDLMEENNKPEILRVHLGMAVLQLMQLGIQNVGQFEFVQPPQDGALEEALKLLEFLGAVGEDCHELTDVGRQMSLLTLEPRLAKLVLTSIKGNMAEEGILVAGLLAAGGNVFYRSGSDVAKRKSDESKLDFSNVQGDIFTMLDVYDKWKEQPEKSRNKWCFARSINAKTMRVVTENIRDIKKSLTSNNLYDGKSGDAIHRNDEKECQILRKIILSVYAQNLCVYNGHPKAGYTVVFQMKTAVLHPSSSLKSLDVFPMWVVYTEFSRTSQDFILNLTPVDPDWIFEVAPNLAKCIDFKSISDNQVHEEIVPCVGPTLMGRIIGKGGQGLRNIEEQVLLMREDHSSTMKTVCVIECINKTGTLGLFVSRNVAASATVLVKETVEAERCSLEKQQLEVAIGHSSSGVRQVIGIGAEPKFILMPEDFRTLEIIGVTEECSTLLNEWLEDVQFKRHIHDIFQFPVHSKQAKRGVWGKVTFTSPLVAQIAQQSFPEDEDMICKAACQGTQGQCALGQELVATWKTGSTRGMAFVTCENFDDANTIQMAINGTRIKQSTVCSRFDKKDPSCLFLRHLGSEVSEADIENHIRQHVQIQIQRISIPRNPPQSVKSDNQFREELKTLLVNYTDKAKIDVRIPPRKSPRPMQNAAVDIQKSRNMIAFITLSGVSTDVVNQVIAEAPSLPNNLGHQLSIKRLVKSRLFCPGYVYKIVKDDLKNAKLAAERMFKEARIFIDEKNEKTSGIFINLEFKNPDDLVKVQAQFVTVINGIEVTVCGNKKVLREISGNYWRQFLDKAEQTTNTRAFYDNRDKLIRVYGTDENAQNMIESIVDFIIEAENNMCEINLSEFTKAKGRALQKLRKVFGADLIKLKASSGAKSISYIFKSRIIVVHGEASTQTKTRDLIRDCLQREGIECDQEDVVQEDECGVCFSPVESDSHRLEGCGHNYCKECLMGLLKHCVDSKEFPIVCPRDNCTQSLFMCDINLLTRGNQAKGRLYAATLDTFIAQNSEYKYCITPNCTMVYHSSSNGKLFVCCVCNQQFCTSCKLDHPGMTCGEYKANKETSDSVLDWAKKNKKDVKPCKCGAIIEKTGGCLKMHCTRCRKCMCWVCSKIFDTEAACYDHLSKVHSGIFG